MTSVTEMIMINLALIGCAHIHTPGFVKKISGPQPGETGADDHNGLVGIERTRGDASNGGDAKRKPTHRLLKESSSIHVLFLH